MDEGLHASVRENNKSGLDMAPDWFNPVMGYSNRCQSPSEIAVIAAYN